LGDKKHPDLSFRVVSSELQANSNSHRQVYKMRFNFSFSPSFSLGSERHREGRKPFQRFLLVGGNPDLGQFGKPLKRFAQNSMRH
jgi:hypothetical protein